ncbi:MAG: glycoside hydrolase family 25 protein [Lachnospiraceae bacterium]|nr:glycoside hydrolase family 25 protein [Lachnospiraceae bacterium]
MISIKEERVSIDMENMQQGRRMQRHSPRKKAGGTIITVLLLVTTIVSAALAAVFGIGYVQGNQERNALVAQYEARIAELESAEPAVSDSIELPDAKTSNTSEEYVQVMGDGENAIDISTLLQEKEDELEASIKERMKELVTAEDGSQLKMLRSFFPENLIYADKDEYVFAPVLDGVKKHNYLDENFVSTDDGEMQYIENGEVISHKGIDVSKYQGNIDWPAVASDGVEYAFVRLGLRGYGSGKLVLDEFFDQNMRGAKDAGIKTGVYFFTQAITVEEAIEEADYVLENITGYDVSYPIVFDVEMITNDDGRANDLSQKDRTDIAIAFCDRIKAAGFTPMIYGNVKCFTKLLDMTRLNDYEKWYAFYDDYMYMPYEVGIWQYTEKGKVAGINTGVDLNISYKEY